MRFNRRYGAVLSLLAMGAAGCVKPDGPPEMAKRQGADAVPMPAASPSLVPSDAASKSKENAELLREVYSVVFMREPEDRSSFGSYLDSMNQGASLEGVYNGFTHSSFYRDLEIGNPGSTSDALKIFAEELAIIELELPSVREFARKDALPLAKAVELGAAPTEVDYTRDQAPAKKATAKELVSRYERLFSGASIYTLKRVLGDEALQLVSTRRNAPEKFALWYAAWVKRLVERKVDFGVELRNRPDEELHWSWALKASEDRVAWEVLNRLHRLLNEANQRRSKES